MGATVLFFVLWAGCLALVGWIAARKGREAAQYVVLAFFLSVIFSAGWMKNWVTADAALRAVEDEVAGRPPAPPAYPFGPWPTLLGGAIAGLLVAAFTPNRNRKKCPDCGEAILKDARICRFCRHSFDSAAENPN